MQVGVQLGAVADLGHRRGPVALQVPHAAFDARLLLRAAHQAEARLEQVVTGQGLVAVVEQALAADADVGRHGFGIVPPQFARHATEEGERFDQAVQDGFGALAWQREGEGAVGIAPGDQQHRHELPARGEVNVDVAEVGFEALAGSVGERDEGLGRPRLLSADIEADPFGAAAVAVLGAEPAADLGGGVALLARRLLIGAQDGVDQRLERIEDRRRRRRPAVRRGLGLAENLADLAARVLKAAG